jgi:hypothetical protein
MTKQEMEEFGAAPTCYLGVLEIIREYPWTMTGLIECENLCGKNSSLEALHKFRPNLEHAIEILRKQIEAGMHIPYVWYDIAFFQLLLFRPYESMESYGKGMLFTCSPDLVETIYNSLTKIHKKVTGKEQKMEWGLTLVRSLLRVVLVGRFKKSAEMYLHGGDADLDRSATLSPSKRDGLENPFVSEEPVVLVAGSCSQESQPVIDSYAHLINEAFSGYRGILCSGGTESGIAGVISRLRNKNGAIRKLAYLPKEGLCAADYQCIRTVSGTFSALDPIMLWADLLDSGRDPETIRVLGVCGGEISACEFQLGLLLGTKVAILPESGGVSKRIADDPDWCNVWKGHEKPRNLLLRLPADLESFRAFILPTRASSMIDTDTREYLAAEIHEGYSQLARQNMYSQYKNIATWDMLDETFKEADRRQVDQIEEKLRRIDLVAHKVEGYEPQPFEFSQEQVEKLAEMEHGLWVIECLEDGWSFGELNDVNKTRPQLIAWSELPKEEKEKDYDTIKKLPQRLAKYGYEITPGEKKQ